MSSQYGELRSTNVRERLEGLRHPSKFQLGSPLCFVTAATSFNGSQPNFARCLAICWAGTLYIHFWGLLPLTEFCQVKNSLCVQVLRSPVLAALLHDKLCGMVQGMELWKFRSSSFSTEDANYIPRAAITLGKGPQSSWLCISLGVFVCPLVRQKFVHEFS